MEWEHLSTKSIGPQTHWSLVQSSASQLDSNVLEPLAMDFSFLHNHSENFYVNNVCEDSNIYSENVSRRVACKMKSIASCIGCCFGL